MERDLVRLLTGSPASCRLLVEQTAGPYHRRVHPMRRDITEGRPGLPLRVGLRLTSANGDMGMDGVLVEVWQADADGRYSGFEQFVPEGGEEVTEESVSREVVAPEETFLRGAQRTDPDGLCAFDSIYPGWYAGRTVHIHLIAHLPDGSSVTSQLYFPDDVTDVVHMRPPYQQRGHRDTTNRTDSVLAEAGTDTIVALHPGTDPATEGYTAILCATVDASDDTGPAGPDA